MTMRTWQLGSRPAAAPVPADAVAALLADAPQPGVAQGMLQLVDRLLPVDYLSLVEYLPPRRGEALAVPELAEAVARPGIVNLTPDCFARYRRAFWRRDDGTRLATEFGRRASAGLLAAQLRLDDIADAEWREQIYERAHLSGRLSLFYTALDGRTFGVNLYRDRARGDFGEAEIERLLGVAPLLRQAHRCRICSLAPQCRQALSVDARVRLAEARLQRLAPELSPRERAVCARIACGISADGIACELGVAPSTVATLRKRAYGKLAAQGVVGGRLRLAALLH